LRTPADPGYPLFQTFHVSPDQTEGRLVYELGNGRWYIPFPRSLLENMVATSSAFDNFEPEHTFPAIGRRARLPTPAGSWLATTANCCSWPW